MTIVKIVLVGVAIIAVMVVANNQHWGQRFGVVGTCATTPPPRSQPEGFWYACKEGVLSGYPNLEADSCTSDGIVQHREIWNCLAPVKSAQGT